MENATFNLAAFAARLIERLCVTETTTPFQIFLIFFVDAIAIGIITYFAVKQWPVKRRFKGESK